MVLVDTSIWIAHLRFGNPPLEALLSDAQVMCHPFIIGELACGNLKNRKEILTLFQSLPSAPVADPDDLLYFIERNALWGKGLGFVDAHLLASAQLMGVPLWTSDNLLKKSAVKLKLSYSR